MREKRRESVKIAIYFLLMLVFIAVFVLFGKRRYSSAPTATYAVSKTPSPTEVPKGVPLKSLISSLDRAFLDSVAKVELSPAQTLDDGRLLYTLALSFEREGSLTVTTDAIGRVTAVELRISYIHAPEPGDNFSAEIREVIKRAHKDRENDDIALIESYTKTVFELFGESANIGSIDETKIASELTAAYRDRKSRDKKAGKARFFCDTASEDGYNFVFTVLTEFNY